MRARDGLSQVTSGRVTPAKIEAFRQHDQPTTLGRRLPDGVNGTAEVGLRAAWFDQDLAHSGQEIAHCLFLRTGLPVTRFLAPASLGLWRRLVFLAVSISSAAPLLPLPERAA